MITGNEPAMPVIVPDGDMKKDGLTIRQYFAAMAMQGHLASFGGSTFDPLPGPVAKYSVEFADALIAELNKPQSPQSE